MSILVNKYIFCLCLTIIFYDLKIILSKMLVAVVNKGANAYDKKTINIF